MQITQVSDVVEPFYWSDVVNDDLILYQGRIELSHSDLTISGKGIIQFQSLPSPRVKLAFWSENLPENPFAVDIFFQAPARNLRIELLDLEGRIPDVAPGFDDTFTEAEATALLEKLNDQRSIDYNSSRLLLLRTLDNIEVLPGDRLKYVILSIMNFQPSRSGDRREKFHVGDFVVTLNDRASVETLKSVERGSGFAFTTACRIERIDAREFSIKKAEDVLSALWHALSFAHGAHVCLALMAGFAANDLPIYAKWHPTTADPWRTRLGWCDPDDIAGVAQVASHLGKSEGESRAITERWIRFYLTGNNPAPREAGTVLAFAGLESLSWWQLCVHDNWLDTETADGMKASSRIALFLKTARIPTEVPVELPKLQALCEDQNQKRKRSGPELLATTRNAIAHTTDLKRLLEQEELTEAWRLATWYLELAILFVCGYEGPDYVNRLNRAQYTGVLTTLPWIK